MWLNVGNLELARKNLAKIIITRHGLEKSGIRRVKNILAFQVQYKKLHSASTSTKQMSKGKSSMLYFFTIEIRHSEVQMQ